MKNCTTILIKKAWLIQLEKKKKREAVFSVFSPTSIQEREIQAQKKLSIKQSSSLQTAVFALWKLLCPSDIFILISRIIIGTVPSFGARLTERKNSLPSLHRFTRHSFWKIIFLDKLHRRYYYSYTKYFGARCNSSPVVQSTTCRKTVDSVQFRNRRLKSGWKKYKILIVFAQWWVRKYRICLSP